jgi:hypothetical protein
MFNFLSFFSAAIFCFFFGFRLVEYHKTSALINKKKYDLAYEKYLQEFNEKAKYIISKDPKINPMPKSRRDEDWSNLMVYAHNLSGFDGTFLFSYLISKFSSQSIKVL